MILYNPVSSYARFIIVAGIWVIGIAGCKLTEKNVTGTWVSNFSDTLHVYENHSFLAVPHHNQAFHAIMGEWGVSPNSLSLYVAGTHQQQRSPVYCGGLSKSGGFIKKSSLVNPWVCDQPSHRFISFRKLK